VLAVQDLAVRDLLGHELVHRDGVQVAQRLGRAQQRVG
jgi:hypothetical protein